MRTWIKSVAMNIVRAGHFSAEISHEEVVRRSPGCSELNEAIMHLNQVISPRHVSLSPAHNVLPASPHSSRKLNLINWTSDVRHIPRVDMSNLSPSASHIVSDTRDNCDTLLWPLCLCVTVYVCRGGAKVAWSMPRMMLLMSAMSDISTNSTHRQRNKTFNSFQDKSR